MKHMIRISIVSMMVAVFFFLLPFNHHLVPLKLWGDIFWDIPLWTLLVFSFIAGAIGMIMIWAFGAAAQAMSRRKKAWEPKGRKIANKWLNRGRAALEKGNDEEAREYLMKAQKHDPRYARVYGEMARLNKLQGDHSEAYEEARKAVNIEPDDIELLEQLAEYSLDRDDPNRAADALMSILDLEPGSYKVLNLLPKTLIQAGRWEEALKAQETLLARLSSSRKERANATKLGIQTELARALLSNNPKRSVKLLKEALKQSPGFAPAAILLAQYWTEREKASKAQGVLRDAFEANPNAILYERLARLEGEDAFELAQSLAGKALENNPRLNGLRLVMARILLDRGRPRDGIEELDKIRGESGLTGELLRIEALMKAASPEKAQKALARMIAKSTIDYSCMECGHSTSAWAPRCIKCGEWNSFEAGRKENSTARPKGDRNIIE